MHKKCEDLEDEDNIEDEDEDKDVQNWEDSELMTTLRAKMKTHNKNTGNSLKKKMISRVMICWQKCVPLLFLS